MRRAVLLLILVIGLAPGTWWRSPSAPADTRQVLQVLPLAGEGASRGPVRLLGAWELRSPNDDFHGYSALAAMADNTLLAVSDSGRMMRFAPPGESGRRVELGAVAPGEKNDKRLADVEAIARDGPSGRLWVAYEGSNAIERHEPDGTVIRAQPPAMRRWASNAGPEAMARLTDGRFIVLSEGRVAWIGAATRGLLFPGDPVEGARPAEFRFAPPDGYRPVDIGPLPDGRVLVLLRSVEWGWPPSFGTRVVLADPAQIRAGETWRGQTVFEIAEPSLSENYEGLAIVPGKGGDAVVWLISDDNRSAFQRTLLLKLSWQSNEKARGASRALR